MDLLAINVQRGREHGIPDYNTVRAFCGLPKAETFDDLINEIEQKVTSILIQFQLDLIEWLLIKCSFIKTIDDLKIAYTSVDDIDLYIGCLAESSKSVNGSVFGPTGLCVVAKQFAVTKNNDRFFYDVGNQASSFTLGKTFFDQVKKIHFRFN